MKETTFKELTSTDEKSSNDIVIIDTSNKPLIDQCKDSILSLFKSMSKEEILEFTRSILEEEESKSE